eukprot:gnl/TRDRNA2_/TRDRNA2_83860_c0_seq1.p1 gnl/TRDRNA2_/TRDRNA2_83860_c0~~gnl/TRDRNA2_/TRDRNA2_83860_c0_seq1.p1  ORF type:complete len:647 (-),score=114.66 gnl/TRDRNA2_/TRDRNA2_83860_c0_seq1:38-1978(-)
MPPKEAPGGGDPRNVKLGKAPAKDAENGGASKEKDIPLVEPEATFSDEEGSEDDDGLGEDKMAEFELDVDVYNVFLMSYLHQEKVKDYRTKCNMILWPLFLAVFAVVVQFVMSRTVVIYVKTDMHTYMNMDPNRVLYNYANMNRTMTDDEAASICGEFPTVEVNQELPGANVTLPDGVEAMLGTKVFWSKLPAWRWDAQWLGADKSLLDTIRYVASEKFMYFHQGYAILFMLTMMLWLCSIAVELRGITRMALMLWGLPHHTDNEFCITNREEDDKWIMNHMGYDAKAIGFSIVLTRLCLAIIVGYSGVYFLRFTNALVDLILNALALEFILALDSVLAGTVLSQPQQHFIETLEPIEYEAVLPKWYRGLLRHYFPVFGIFVLTSLTVYIRSVQIDGYSKYFNNAAAACLFLGSSENPEIFRPAAGLCESVMRLTCTDDMEAIKKYGWASPCVITDYDIPWGTDVEEPSLISTWPDELYTYMEKDNEGMIGDAFSWLMKENVDPNRNTAKKFRLVDSASGFQDNGVAPPFHHMLDVMNKVCFSMFHSGQEMTEVKGALAAPFYCSKSKSTGLNDYFMTFEEDPKNPGKLKREPKFKYEYETSWLVPSLRMDVSPPLMDLANQDPELGAVLSKCKAVTVAPPAPAPP